MTYIIAEIGQNHNGDFATAMELVKRMGEPVYSEALSAWVKGPDAVKFCKRDMEWELTDEFYNEPYNSPHAYGDTYGEHREALELSISDYGELSKIARSYGLDFGSTVCSPTVVEDLFPHVDFYKIASRDLTNTPLIEKVATMGKTTMVSTGMMQDSYDLDRAIGRLVCRGFDVVAMHCVSSYPAHPKTIDLRRLLRIRKYQDHGVKSGYSDHSIGISAPLGAVAYNAEYIEKHVTLGRKAKGSDHAGSLEVDDFMRMVVAIRELDLMLQPATEEVNPELIVNKLKLERCLCYARSMSRGEKVFMRDFCFLSPGIKVKERIGSDYYHNYNGLTLKRDVLAKHPVSQGDFEQWKN